MNKTDVDHPHKGGELGFQEVERSFRTMLRKEKGYQRTLQ